MNNDFASAYFQSNGTNAYTTIDPQQISAGYEAQQNVSNYPWTIPEQTTTSTIIPSTSINSNNLSSPVKNGYPTPGMEINTNNYMQIQNTPVVGSNVRSTKSKIVESTVKNVTNNTSHISLNRSPEYGGYFS